MISIPVHSKLAKMPLRERFNWALSNIWGVGFALFTIWFYVPYCRRRIRQNNGRDAALSSALGESLLAVKIPSGEHEIEFEYDPVCVRRGLAISTAGLALFSLACVFENQIPTKRKKRTP